MIEERLAAVIAGELTGSGRSQTAVNELPSRSTSTCTSPPGNLDDPLPTGPWAAAGILHAINRVPRSPWPDEDTGGVQLPLSGTLPVPLTDPGCALPSAPLTRNPGFMIQGLRAALAPVEAECPRHRIKGPASKVLRAGHWWQCCADEPGRARPKGPAAREQGPYLAAAQTADHEA